MNVLTDLHGTAALIVVCGLLMLDEAGLPIPLAPSEVLLILGGLLVASDSFPLWVFLIVAGVAMFGGMLGGYGWARALGETALGNLAEKVHAEDAYRKAKDRLSSAGPMQIGTARLLPGARPYATLISGAAEVDLRTFLIGAVPALLIWEGVWTAIGMLVGVPAVHVLGKVEKFAFRGGLLIAAGVLAFFALRKATTNVEIPSRWVPPRGRAVLAATIDGSMVASIVSGVLLLVHHFFHFGHVLIDTGILAVIVAAYLVMTPDVRRVTVNGVLLREDRDSHDHREDRDDREDPIVASRPLPRPGTD